MNETEKTFIIGSIQRSVDHFQRIVEDIKAETDDKEIQYYLREGRSAAEALRWEFDGRIRALDRAFKEKYAKK